VTIQTALAMNEIISQFGLESLDITSFEAVSGEGQPAVTELANQAISLFNTKPVVNRHFPVQIAFNTIPSMVDFESGESYSEHEKQILGEIENFLPQISGRVCVNSFFVPVFYGHSTLFSFSTSMPVSVEEIRQVLADSSMISYVDREVVTPVTHGVSRDLPVVTRLRRSTAGENQFNLFSVIDNSLKGEVLNCIQIAEKIIEYIG
jgi:aspartate-semialdehyde dehydrogenase